MSSDPLRGQFQASYLDNELSAVITHKANHLLTIKML